MGGRWILILDCAKCGAEVDDIWYAPSSDITTFVCPYCQAVNEVIETFVAVLVDAKEP